MSKRIKKNRSRHALPTPYKRDGNKINPFDARLSLQIDKATVALEAAEEAGDEIRAGFARVWKGRLEEEL